MRHQLESLGTTATHGRPFAKGNPGRKPGSRNRATMVAAALQDGEAEALRRKSVEVALAGNALLLKFFAERLYPRERLICLELPAMEFADDAVEALGAVVRAVSEGKISPSEGAALASVIKSYTEAIQLADVVRRMDKIEAQISGIAFDA